MKLFIGLRYVAAAFAVAAVATLGANSVFAQQITVGERVGNARPNHYDPITHKQMTGWMVEETAPQEAPAPRKLYMRTTQPSRNLRPNQ